MTNSAKSEDSKGGSKQHAILVAAGILLSRIAGLIRERVFAHYFGNSDAADAFKAAFRIPNFLQNLFGEGVLSASFIPVYAKLLAHKDDEEARRTAGAVAALLALTTSLIVLVGVLTTPYLIDAIAGGFTGAKRELTIRLVRILFPSAGLLVFSAWCLGVLNSHRRFFLSYAAPVVWNAAMIGTMWGWGRHNAEFPLAQILAWGSVAGSALQVIVQLPVVLRLLKGLHLSLNYRTENVKTVVSNFIPVFVGRGVVQISAYVDTLLASWLPMGAVAALSYAQILYLLPVSLFGMSVSASELPHMSGTLGSDEEVAATLREEAQLWLGPDRHVRGAVGRGFPDSRRRDRGGDLPHWAVQAGRRDLCLGHSCGRHSWPAGFYARAAVFLDLLCIARYADTAALCHRSRDSDDHSRTSLCVPTAAFAGDRGALGSGGADHFRWDILLGGIRVTPTNPEPPHRLDGDSRALIDQALDRRTRRGHWWDGRFTTSLGIILPFLWPWLSWSRSGSSTSGRFWRWDLTRLADSCGW